MMMNNFLGSLVIFFSIGLVSSTYISGAVFETRQSHSRSLLQAKKNCQINFEDKNYTILTSQCKGPKYTADTCCKAFKEFACPFGDQIEDPSTNCADTMFSYMNLYGSYPPGTFASLCKEGKNGLDCYTNDVPESWTDSVNSNNAMSPMTVVLVSSFVFLFHLL